MVSEKHHAQILVCFYQALREARGEEGAALFRKAAQTYGEQRGKRMSLRALRDGNRLDFDGYFAYGEWSGTPGAFDMSMSAGPGMVAESVTRCPWADVFREEGAPDCGECYCREIDRAIVRGFSPALLLEQGGTIHREGRCEFYFRDGGVTEHTLSAPALPRPVGRDCVQPFAYHVGHVYQTFARTVEDALGREPVERVRGRLLERFGEPFLELLDSYRETDFTRLPGGADSGKGNGR